MITTPRFSRSFLDALSIARNRRDQSTIYYRKDGLHAVYEVTTEMKAEFSNVGSIIIAGHHVTAKDLPPKLKELTPTGVSDDQIVFVQKYAKAAQEILVHNGVDVTDGWDLRP